MVKREAKDRSVSGGESLSTGATEKVCPGVRYPSGQRLLRQSASQPNNARETVITILRLRREEDAQCRTSPLAAWRQWARRLSVPA